MNSPSSSDVSLYELALKSESSLSALQISPQTLKFINDSILNLLSKHSIAAIVWAKLPRGEAWWAALEQYATEGNAKAIYLFQHHREEADDHNDGSSTGAHLSTSKATAETSPQGLLIPKANAPVLSMQFSSDSPLKREYFLIVWSAELKVGVFAHRPRSVQPSKTIDSSILVSDLMSSYGHPSQLLDSTQERKQLLLMLTSFNAPLLQTSLQGLEEAIALSSPQIIDKSAAAPPLLSTAANEVPEYWRTLLADIPATPTSDTFYEHLFSKHVKHQEELQQRSSTYRKQAENAETLRLQNEELLNNLRLKDDFLNNVGQELRTPLTTIKTALSLLGSPNLKPPQRQRYMDLIAKECDRQSTLITSLLDLAHLEQIVDQSALPPIRLVDVVPGVVSTYQPIAEEKGIRLAYTIPEDLPAVACMTNWLKQIVINLLHNAIKYTPKGGQVWVRAKQQGEYAQLEVRDTGIGIAPTEIPKVFDRFYRVRQSADDSSGAGLGLTIVQQLLLHCGGSISVKSKLTEGSTFNVLLPIYKGASEQTL